MKETYYVPTRIVAAENCVGTSAELLRSFGKRAMIVTGAHAAKACGALDDVTTVLAANHQSYLVYNRVPSNPSIGCCYTGAELARAEQADFVIAIGGGSPMDAAKAIALLARQDIARESLFSGNYSADVLRMVCVPTTAGTGSEVTQYAVLTNDTARTKMSIASPVLFPQLALLDARYLKSLPSATVVNTALDALSHSVEGMLSARAGSITDVLAREGIGRICACFPSVGAGRLTDTQRWSLLHASTLGGMVIANTGTTAVHSMGYPLTYFRHIDHGRANALLLCNFLAFVSDKAPEKVSQILTCCRMDSLTELSAAVDRLLGEKETLTAEEIEAYSSIAIRAGNIRNCVVVPEKKDLKELYRKSMADGPAPD